MDNSASRLLRQARYPCPQVQVIGRCTLLGSRIVWGNQDRQRGGAASVAPSFGTHAFTGVCHCNAGVSAARRQAHEHLRGARPKAPARDPFRIRLLRGREKASRT